MKICFFSKYPPIEGGVSSRTYWFSKALGERGIEVHLVTNAFEVEEIYKEKIDWKESGIMSKYQPDNVFVHNLHYSNHSLRHIPSSPAYLERLVNRGLEIIEQFDCDLIDSFYTLPYGLAGFITKILTGRPQILRHAGSDIGRLFFHPDLTKIFVSVFREIDCIVSSSLMVDFFRQYGVGRRRISLSRGWSVYPLAFNPNIQPYDFKKLGINVKKDAPIITYIGKFSQKFKGLYELVETLNSFKTNFFLILVTNGQNLEEFQSYLKTLKGLRGKYKIVGFLPPWEIPHIIKGSCCLVQLEKNFPIKTHSPVQLQEAMAVGKACLVSDEIYLKYKYHHKYHFRLKDRKNLLVANPKNRRQLKEKLKLILAKPEILDKIGRAAYNLVDWQKEFNQHIEENLNLYEKIRKRRTGRQFNL